MLSENAYVSFWRAWTNNIFYLNLEDLYIFMADQQWDNFGNVINF